MKFPAKHSEDFAPVPAGSHAAICNAVVDLGLQPGSAQFPDQKHQVYIRFELPAERIRYNKDGVDVEGPMSIGRTFTASMGSKANLRKFVEGWRGASFTDAQAADFDFQKLLGQRCLVNITHNVKGDKTYANLVSAMPLPKGMTSNEQQHNKSLYFSLDNPDSQALAALPEWLRKKISERLEEPEQRDNEVHDAVEAGGLDPNDDIPF
jgi:hypothetical protein